MFSRYQSNDGMQTLSVNRQPKGLMATQVKAAATRGFRPRGKTAERLEYADALGLNIAELVNEVLDAHLRVHLETVVRKKSEEIEARQKKLQAALLTPVP